MTMTDGDEIEETEAGTVVAIAMVIDAVELVLAGAGAAPEAAVAVVVAALCAAVIAGVAVIVAAGATAEVSADRPAAVEAVARRYDGGRGRDRELDIDAEGEDDRAEHKRVSEDEGHDDEEEEERAIQRRPKKRRTALDSDDE
ncbi:hypothetical protein BGX21_004559 [Mortierella sp. AD011]|nr:hypothetical protein BGX21_004559 [Mortierella sp. AD011]